MSRGRPSKLTEAVAARIVDAIKNGSTIQEAADAEGIGRSTIQEWIAAGKAGVDGAREFAEEIAEARQARKRLKQQAQFGEAGQLDLDVAARICQRVRAGMRVETAAEAEGVPRWQFQQWLARGRAGQSPYAELAGEILIARARAVNQLEHLVLKAAASGKEDGPRYAQWLLERAEPELYASRKVVHVEVQREVERVFDAVRPMMSQEAYAELIEAVASVVGVDREGAAQDGTGDNSRVH